jgi:hypothetical protein
MAANLNRLTVTNTTTTRDGVEIVGTAGDAALTANIQNLVVNVDGNGLDVQDDVTLGASGVNTITTETGVGLQVVDSAIAAGGAAFRSVNVTAGTSNGIVLENLTGGTLSVTGTGTTDASGGTINTAAGQDAIVLTNAGNVSLSNVTVSGSGNHAVAITKDDTTAMTATINNLDVTAASDDAINANVTTSGTLNLNVNNSTVTAANDGFQLSASGTAADVNVMIDNFTSNVDVVVDTANSTSLDFRVTDSTIDASTLLTLNGDGDLALLFEDSALDAATGTALDIALGSNSEDSDIIIRDNEIESSDAIAFEFTATGTGVDSVFLLDNNEISNASAGSETASILISGGAILDANVVNNDFSNSLAATTFEMEANGSSTRINLNLDNNSANQDYELITSNNGGNFNFGVVDRDNADANNVGTVNFNPLITDFEDITGPVPEPVLP